nr:nuclease-related domain-containing protein [Alteribacter populi]
MVPEYNRLHAGFKGEKKLEYYLHLLQRPDYHIIHNLRLESGPYFFQIDLLLVSPKLIIILEVKNLSGKIVIDPPLQQVIQTTPSGEKRTYTDFILQAKSQQEQLIRWIKAHKLASLPVEYLVIMVNERSQVEFSPPKPPRAYESIIRPGLMSAKISSFEKSYNTEVFPKKDVKKLSRKMINKDASDDLDLLDRFHITEADLMKGFHCEHCGYIPLVKNGNRWICQKCHLQTENPALLTLKDYALLLGPSITNQEFRHFAKVHSTDTAKRLLQAQNLPHIGTNRGRVYNLHNL